MVSHRCNKETDIELIKQDIAHMKTILNDVHKSIVGNGKPGLQKEVQSLSLIQEQHIQVLRKHNQVIDTLNIKMAGYAGAIAVIVFMINHVR